MKYSQCIYLLNQRTMCLVLTAIWVSTSAMAILEPCLPIWLMDNLHPKRWQMGTVFIPDSVGYFVGTSFFAPTALKVGQLRVAVCALVIVGVSCLVVSASIGFLPPLKMLYKCGVFFQIPTTSSVLGLLLPHFTLGLGIGILDAALVPFLATYVDQQNRLQTSFDANTDVEWTPNENCDGANYGIVYAIQQMAVSLAYAISPLIGGEIAQYFSFASLMIAIGLANIAYAAVLLLVIIRRENCRLDEATAMDIKLEILDMTSKRNYIRFYDNNE